MRRGGETSRGRQREEWKGESGPEVDSEMDSEMDTFFAGGADNPRRELTTKVCTRTLSLPPNYCSVCVYLYTRLELPVMR